MPDPSHIALIALPPTQPQDLPSSQVSSSHSISQAPSKEEGGSKEEETASTPTKEVVFKKRWLKKAWEEGIIDGCNFCRLTLIPRQPPPDIFDDKAAQKRKSLPSGTVPGAVDLNPSAPLDQQLINYAYNFALVAVVSMVGLC